MLTLAIWLAALYKKCEALNWLKRAIALSYNNGRTITIDRYLVILKDDDEFQRLVAQLQ